MAYTFPVSAPPEAPGHQTQARRRFAKTRNFWFRLSEGSRIDDLWFQFTADARSSYGFYGKDVDWDQINSMPRWRRPFHVARQFFWALILKLSPARRVLLFVSLVFLVISGPKIQMERGFAFDFNLETAAAALLLLLLSLELADKVTMKRDLEIAREIQSWLVPAQPPQVSGADIAFATRPQNSVAGDYYDAFYPGEKREKLMVVIADVAGKSVPAALLMATLQASLRTIAGEETPLGELVLRLNRYACAHSLDGRRFTTALIAEYDVATRRMTYVNAGHNPPILLRTGVDGNTETLRLEADGPVVGLLPLAPYTEQAMTLMPGDLLLLYTDGISEAMTHDDEEWGEDRLIASAEKVKNKAACEILRDIFDDADAFTAGAPQHDDMTLLVLKLEG